VDFLPEKLVKLRVYGKGVAESEDVQALGFQIVLIGPSDN